jgi:cytochrome c5
MKKKTAIFIASVLFISACTKPKITDTTQQTTSSNSNSSNSNSNSSSPYYIPTKADTTAKATLSDLTSGRSLLLANCGACHSVPIPDTYSVSQWKSYLPNMASRAQLSASDQLLVLKYVCRGKE